jgi:hypothetical protein
MQAVTELPGIGIQNTGSIEFIDPDTATGMHDPATGK